MSNRLRINTTIARRTWDVIHQVADEQALGTPARTLDYIVNDWVRLKRAALQAAVPSGPCSPLGGCDCPADVEADCASMLVQAKTRLASLHPNGRHE